MTTQMRQQAAGHKHACDVKGCHGAECFDGQIEGCGHPEKSVHDPHAGGARCPWGPWPCPDEHFPDPLVSA
jgi:hypothetical protein